jgi:microcin C transport system permease protein
MLLLLGVFALFGWIGCPTTCAPRFLRNRNLEFVKAARAMGLSNWQIIRRHVLPNSMTPVITFLPFPDERRDPVPDLARFSRARRPDAAVACGPVARREGKPDAWWISMPTFALLVLTLLLLTFIGDALRDAFDTRKS